VIAAATLAMLGAETVSAQYAPPPPQLYRMSRGEAPFPDKPDPRDAMPLSEIEAMAGLDKYADCVVGKRGLRSEVQVFIRAIPGTQQWSELGGKLMVGECLRSLGGGGGVQMSVRMDFLRMAVFGALYRREYRKNAPDMVEGLPPLSLASEFDGPSSQLLLSFRSHRALGDCVARSASADVHTLMFIAPGDARESAVIERIIPVMQGCLDEDQEVTIPHYDLRGILAESVYRLAQASSAALATGAGESAD
jgi:hypothetical protein